MCKLIGIVYFLLFANKLVNCEDPLLVQEEDIKSASNEKSDETARNQENHNSNETSKVFTINGEKHINEPEQYDRSGRVKETDEETATEEMTRNTDSPKSTIFVGSLAKTLHDELNGENVSDDIAVERTGADSHQEESIDGADTGEIFIYTPQKNTLSQDPVLDLKARTGRVEDDQAEKGDDDSNHDQGSRIGQFPRGSESNNNNMRSGYVAPDDDDLKPSDQQQQGVPNAESNGYPFNYRNFNQPYPIINRKSKLSPESDLQNSQKLSPLYESVKSREMLYPAYSSRELMSQTNSYTGNVLKSYLGLHYPNRQLFNARPIDMCSSCNLNNLKPIDRARSREIYISPDDHGYRRSIQRVFQPDIKLLETANGRSVDYDPSAANDYPLQVDHDENIVDVNKAHSSRSHEVMIDPGKNGVLYSKDVDGTLQTKTGPLTKVLMSLPAYNIPRNSPLLRINLGAG